MKISDVVEELAARLRKIPGLSVFAHPVDTVVPPAAIVVYPDSIAYDQAYVRGMDRITIPVVVVVGRSAHGRATMDALSGYWDGAGPLSVKAALEAGSAGAGGVLDYVHVPDSRAGDVSIGGVPMLAAEFTVEIVGDGA